MGSPKQPSTFAEALEVEIQRSNASGGMCRIAIRKAKLKPTDREKVEQAVAAQVSAAKIGAAFKAIADEGDLPIGDGTVKKHRLHQCSCWLPGGEFYTGGDS
jgi:hypothetical protein